MLSLLALFWHLAFNYYMFLPVLSGAGFSSKYFLPKPGSTAESGNSPNFCRFFPMSDGHRQPEFLVTSPGNLQLIRPSSSGHLHGLDVPCSCFFILELFSPHFSSLNLWFDYEINMTLNILHTLHYSLTRLITTVFYFSEIHLFIYSGICQLLPVACCQVSSSTMSRLLTLHLSHQHITAYLF